MALKDTKPVLLRTENDDPELKAFIAGENTLPWLSETRSYAVLMADTISYRIMLGDELIGEAAFKSVRWFNRKAQLSVFIGERHRSAGIGTKVLRQMISIAFGELDFVRLEAEIYAYNEPSLILAAKLGFVKEGQLRKAKYLNGQYYDILVFGLLREEYKG
jgi:RimJ/RimL family protein N-acetyltransferase